jgi:hypothetical protein
MLTFCVFFHGPLAQQVEQGTLNPKVTGSIPVRPTSVNPQYEEVHRKASILAVFTDKPLVPA